MRLEPGRVVATPGALEVLEEAGVEPRELLRRHLSGDWGELDAHDRRENERSLKHGFRGVVELPGRGGRAKGLGNHRGRPLLDLPPAAERVLMRCSECGHEERAMIDRVLAR